MAVDAARSEEGFTSAAATRVMVAACRAVGLDDRGAELIRLGENALFRLASVPVIVRVARAPEWLAMACKEVAVSRWLAEEGFPAARVVEDLEQAVLIDGHPVTFWHLIVEGDRKASYGELGAVLRDLHALTVPDGLELPSFDPFDKQQLRLDRAVILRMTRRSCGSGGTSCVTGTPSCGSRRPRDRFTVTRTCRTSWLMIRDRWS